MSIERFLKQPEVKFVSVVMACIPIPPKCYHRSLTYVHAYEHLTVECGYDTIYIKDMNGNVVIEASYASDDINSQYAYELLKPLIGYEIRYMIRISDGFLIRPEMPEHILNAVRKKDCNWVY